MITKYNRKKKERKKKGKEKKKKKKRKTKRRRKKKAGRKGKHGMCVGAEERKNVGPFRQKGRRHRGKTKWGKKEKRGPSLSWGWQKEERRLTSELNSIL